MKFNTFSELSLIFKTISTGYFSSEDFENSTRLLSSGYCKSLSGLEFEPR